MPHIIIPFIPFINNNNNVNFRPLKTGIYAGGGNSPRRDSPDSPEWGFGFGVGSRVPTG